MKALRDDARRQQKHRLRLAGKIAPVQLCPGIPPATCGRRIYNPDRKFCRTCWRKTPEGRAYMNAAREASLARYKAWVEQQHADTPA